MGFVVLPVIATFGGSGLGEVGGRGERGSRKKEGVGEDGGVRFESERLGGEWKGSGGRWGKGGSRASRVGGMVKGE